MRVYEELFIVRASATEEEANPLLEQIRHQITDGGGTIEKEENWGVRRLAYRVQKQSEGRYILFQFSAGPTVVKELERRLRVSDLVIKFITVRIDEKMKKVEKRRKAREKRAARKPQAPQAAPAMPTAEQQMLAEASAEMPAMPAAE